MPCVLQDRRVVVTGASAGVGRAAALAFARRGAHLALIGRSASGLQSAVDEIRAEGGRADAFPADVADSADLAAAAERIDAALGPPDIWVNNAMVTVFAPVWELSADEFRRVTEVTYLGSVYGTTEALRRMRPRNQGTILQVGSALAYRSIPLQSAYCGAKHALRGFLDSLRSELMAEDSRIALCMVHMPALNTPQFSWARNKLPRKPQPMPPIFQPEIAAEAVVWAAEHPQRELWVAGSTWQTIVANRLAPGLLDRYLAAKGMGAQQRAEPEPGDRPDNLFEPVEGLHATHGLFDGRAKEKSLQLQLSSNRRTVALASLAGLLAAGMLLAATRKGRRAGTER